MAYNVKCLCSWGIRNRCTIKIMSELTQNPQLHKHIVGRSFTSGQKIKVELEDGTVWDAEVSEENTVLIDCTPEYMSYYEWNFGGGNGFPTSIDNEYQFEDVKVLGVF